MTQQITHIILLILSFSFWVYASFPMLRYMVDLTEGQFKWKLVLWFGAMILAIFVLKFSIYSLTGWPPPGTWASRLFLGSGLFTSYLVPFLWEYLMRIFRK